MRPPCVRPAPSVSAAPSTLYRTAEGSEVEAAEPTETRASRLLAGCRRLTTMSCRRAPRCDAEVDVSCAGSVPVLRGQRRGNPDRWRTRTPGDWPPFVVDTRSEVSVCHWVGEGRTDDSKQRDARGGLVRADVVAQRDDNVLSGLLQVWLTRWFRPRVRPVG
jgi:hypothetical protein